MRRVPCDNTKLPFSINMNVRLVFTQLHAEMYACENRASMRYRYTCKQGVYIVHGDNETMHNHAAYIRYVNACKLCFNTLTSMVEMQWLYLLLELLFEMFV